MTGEEEGAMLARLIGRVRIEIRIEAADNEGLSAVWTSQMPFSPAAREFRTEFASKDSVCERGKKKSRTHYQQRLFSQLP